MAKSPPLLPTEVLRRVLRVARFHGTSVLAISGACALISAWCHDPTDTVAGLLIAAAGAIELHGAGLIHNGFHRGINWLIASHVYLMGSVLGYVSWRLNHVDLSIMAPLATDDVRQQFESLYHLTDTEFLHLAYMGFFQLIGVLTMVYTGGMMIYYASRRARMITALNEIHRQG
jgi:hypothetical protein